MLIHDIIQADVLIVGGTAAAIDLAIEKQGQGLRVMLVTGFTYFGEDQCACLTCTDSTPMAIKRELDRRVLQHGIPFRFRSWPLKLTREALFFGNSEGIFAVQAGVIVDFTQALTVARMSSMPFRPFQPGAIPYRRTIITQDHTYEVLQGTVAMENDSISAWELAEVEARRQTWSNQHLFTADFCQFATPSTPSGTDPNHQVFLPEQLPAELHRLQDAPRHELELGDLPVLKDVPIFIAGAGTAGAPAGIAAGRYGVRALVVEELAHPGGLGTEGRIAAYWYGLLCGFTKEVDQEVQKLQADQFPHLHETQWSVECKQFYWERELRQAGTEIWYQYTCCGCLGQGNHLEGAIVAGPYGSGIIRAQQFIDATGNANLAAFHGEPTMFADQDEPAVQGSAMSVDVLGVDCLNSDYMFTVDSSNADTTRAFIVGRDRHRMPDNFDLVKLPGTRERRRIVGDIILQPTDFYTNNSYPDTIYMARSNFDTHGFTVHPFLMFQPKDEEAKTVQVPLRALLSPGLDNLLTTGLGVSAHRDAIPLIRMQPDVQNQGYAVGLVASTAVRENLPLRQLDMADIQKELVRQDILPAEILHGPVTIPESAQENAKIFHQPDLAKLIKDFQQSPDFEKALRLALLGDATGQALLEDELRKGRWDSGWNYRGMGQFGMSASRQDVAIMALARLSADFSPMRKLLEALTPDSEFSHIRACCYFLMKHPQEGCASTLENLLSHFTCHAIQNLADLLDSGYNNDVDVTERNTQLKELYLAGALHACQPDNELGLSFLTRYANGVHKFFAIYARKYLQLSR